MTLDKNDPVFSGPTIGEMIMTMIDRYPDRIAFVNPCGLAISYRAIGVQISQAMQLFAAMGLQRGDAVVQLAGNMASVFSVMAACFLGGYKSVTLHPAASLDDHHYILQDCGARLVIVDQQREARARELQALLGARITVLSHDHTERLPALWERAAVHPPAALHNHCEPDTVVRLIYTGGTTGKPKGVMASSASMAWNMLLRMAGHDWSGIRLLCATPLSHASGALIVPVLWHGGAIVLHESFDADRILASVASGVANALFLVPTMLYRLLDHPDIHRQDFSSLRRIIYGAAPTTPARLRQARAVFGPILVQNYGLTEAPSTVLTLNEVDHMDDALLSSAGQPYPGITVRVLDADDNAVPVNTVGEICVRSPLVMSGYWGQPELTAEVTRNGWLHTGDFGYRNERGYFFIVDRAKDIIISGGFNIYPREIEDILATHDSVSSVAVIGVPDPTWGEAVKAVVVPRDGVAPDVESLIALVKARKGSIHAPKTVDIVDALPLTGLGKVDKKALRAGYWGGQTRNVH